MLLKMFKKFKRIAQRFSLNAESNEAIKIGIANQTAVINNKLNEIIAQLKHQTSILQHANGTQELAIVKPRLNGNIDGYQSPPKDDFLNAMQNIPFIIAPNTYNTSHPDYDANLTRNFPGKVLNFTQQVDNPLFSQIKKLMKRDNIPDATWKSILDEVLKEVKTIPHAEQIFERKLYVENYLKQLEASHRGFYRPGWVNLEDALFLYWIVRHLKPKTIVQTGVCNGLSSAFMMLALVKNNQDGHLYVIDLPPIFDSQSSAWKIENKVYGVVIPEGKSSGWLVPDAYQRNFHVQNGDAKDLLPPLLKQLGQLDMFYHDSDHTYDHMMFEFKEVKKYLTKNGVIVADDISWNASLWEFADLYKVPAYNYKGSVGVACF